MPMRWHTVALAFADEVRQARRTRGHSQRQAATLVGVSVQTFLSWERGRVPTVGNIFRLADYLGTTVGELRPLLEAELDEPKAV